MNYENFCKVLAQIEADPDEWDQGTAFDNCFVGIAATLAGCRSVYANVRMNAGQRFLGVHSLSGLASVDLDLDHFRRMRSIYGWTHAALRARIKCAALSC